MYVLGLNYQDDPGRPSGRSTQHNQAEIFDMPLHSIMAEEQSDLPLDLPMTIARPTNVVSETTPTSGRRLLHRLDMRLVRRAYRSTRGAG